MSEIRFKPIGLIRSPFDQPEGMPVQASAAAGVQGRVELDPAYTEGLADLAGFSHIILLYHFHRAGAARLTVVPFLDPRPHGVFATRAPARPNPIGLSVVRLLEVQGNLLRIEGVDVLEGAPLIDIKPYVPAFDVHPADQIGWLADNAKNAASTVADGRFSADAQAHDTLPDKPRDP
ncbi:MAG TPA: tRNA (N6-threonylcarbamoyladenosine(37)-N6)-methyltransferase TrmO [Burkholderiales bacterium]|nr:tRNA (N6-threonylcarbamoyladenosine(37)-N6)-methyltransferase TrmO [Burkholderiales bacterium]